MAREALPVSACVLLRVQRVGAESGPGRSGLRVSPGDPVLPCRSESTRRRETGGFMKESGLAVAFAAAFHLDEEGEESQLYCLLERT